VKRTLLFCLACGVVVSALFLGCGDQSESHRTPQDIPPPESGDEDAEAKEDDDPKPRKTGDGKPKPTKPVTVKPPVDEPTPSDPDPEPEPCGLVGTWIACIADEFSATKVTISASASNQFFESIESFNTGDCQGTPQESFSFEATYSLGPIGTSSAVAGATDATVTPNADLFGCGANQPGYTIMKFDSSCSQFQTSITAPPSCDPANRPTAVDPVFFVKQ